MARARKSDVTRKPPVPADTNADIEDWARRVSDFLAGDTTRRDRDQLSGIVTDDPDHDEEVERYLLRIGSGRLRVV